MPQLDLTELEAKVMWLVLDRGTHWEWLDRDLIPAEQQLFAKVYRAYRGMPPERAA